MGILGDTDGGGQKAGRSKRSARCDVEVLMREREEE